MKEFLKNIFDEGVDGICFLPEENEEELSIKSFYYKKKQSPEQYKHGLKYHIMLYKIDDYGKVYSEDNFTAVLTDPCVYAEWVINCGFYGIISKKTKSSTKFVNEIFKEVKRY